MSAPDTVGSECLAAELKDDKLYTCACVECSRLEDKK